MFFITRLSSSDDAIPVQFYAPLLPLAAHKLLDRYTVTPYSARMSPKNAYKLMGLYMEVLILILQYMVSASLSCFL